jgi:phosphoglycolate phosphatase
VLLDELFWGKLCALRYGAFGTKLLARSPYEMKRTVLLVDLDGTLTNPAAGIVGSFRHALEMLGRRPPPAEELAWIIGPPLRESFAELLGGTEKAEEALGLYRARYGGTGLFEALVYDGVPEMLETLKGSGARLFLCTSKPAVYAERILERFDLARHFDTTYGAELDGRFEDKGDLIAKILADRGLPPETCALLGDRKHDVIGARRCGVPTIGALWGFGGEAELVAAGAAALCAAPRDAPAAFARLP